MTWPSSQSRTDFDAGTDSPAAARTQLYSAIGALNDIIASRAAASGIASLDADSMVPTDQLRRGVAVLTSGAANWTIPAGVTQVWAIVAGAGGGGGYTSVATGGDHGGGGGGGGTAVKLLTGLTPGGTIAYSVGAPGVGGAAGVGDANGTSGGQSSITSGATTVTASGGGGGVGGGTRFGGGGGVGSSGDINLQGAAGVSGGARGGAGGGSVLCGAIAGTSSYFGGGGFGSGDGTAGYDGAGGGVIFAW